MKILVLNSGSSSIKYTLYEKKLNVILKGLIEKIGEKGPRLIHKKGKSELKKPLKIKNHKEGIKLMLETLQDKKWGAIKNVSEISVVGHRVVHGGHITKSTLVTAKTLKAVEALTPLAPLHNPHNVIGIKEARKAMPKTPQVMVFDTAFHHTMPEKAYMYGMPFEFFKKYAVRKYGFHGMSHQYVSMRASKLLRKKNANVVTCHLGAGSSIAAVKAGKSVDTSMGLTPLEGVMMGTRTGDFDPAIIQYLINNYKLKLNLLIDIFNKKSGLLGISGISKDVRLIIAKAKKGNKRCKLALEMFSYRVAKYIASYMAALDKVDAIVFTAGIGENAYYVRKQICDYLSNLGVKLDSKKNRKAVKKEMAISSIGSKVKVFVIPTDEEFIIAKEALSVAK